ncbi:hypothetical protein [Acetobacter ascendens]|uniref:Uncharacterized protein n=1 Tax=Acetobacter ascendens TaxID=481146 RepID=A0A1Y0V1K9_9PROT|nr:hypothetical protein [Acetobacter ascendens]ARW11865.1 hypothetical protein S101447_02828 [Acetobacter ascendens]
MTDTGLGTFGAYMLGRYSAESSEIVSRQVHNFFKPRTRLVSEADYNEAAKLAHRAVEYVQVLDGKLDAIKAELAAERKKSATLEEQLATANAANAELQRRLEAEKAHAVMLDDRLFDLTRRHVRLCKQTGMMETSST